MTIELFKCSFCGKNKRMEFLAQVLDETGALGNIRERMSHTEELRAEAYANYLKETTLEKREEFIIEVRNFDKELKAMFQRIKESKKPVCSSCLVQSRNRAKTPTFTCKICDEEKQGKGTQLHVDDWQDEGISPTELHTFCKNCIDKYALAPPPN